MGRDLTKNYPGAVSSFRERPDRLYAYKDIHDNLSMVLEEVYVVEMRT
jgi:hypothetical protein